MAIDPRRLALAFLFVVLLPFALRRRARHASAAIEQDGQHRRSDAAHAAGMGTTSGLPD